jgi:uncharacterized protein (TIGR03437 family)
MKYLPLAVAFVTLITGPAAGQVPTIRVVNAGSLLADDLSPGSMIAIQGTNLTNDIAESPDVQHPFTVLMGVTVKIGTVPAGLLYISPTQVNAVIDPATPLGAATVTLTSPTTSVSASVNIQRPAAPALFAATGAGSREGAILNAVTFARGPFSVTSKGGPTYLALYLTSLDLSTPPTVTIGGLPAPVIFYGSAPCCAGLQQVNVQVPAGLAGAGRVDVMVASGGRSSNVVETVLLPNPGQGPFAPTAENTPRNREIGAIVYVQAAGIVMVLDEKDDVIRVIDMKQRTVTRTIALAVGAQPFAIAVNSAGTQAVVAERGRAKAAFIDVNKGYVITEIPVGPGPSAVALNGDVALVANADADTVSVISLVLKQVLATVPVGRSPRAVVIDDSTSLAYVANQNSGNVSVIDLGRRTVVDTLTLGTNARPQALRLVPSGGTLAVTEPNAGLVSFFDLTTKARSTARTTATDLQFLRNTAYLSNQIGATAAYATFAMTPAGANLGAASTINLDPGVRSIAIDPLDNLLLVSSESSGVVALIDLTSNRLVGSISAVRSPTETIARDDRSDREHANNTPVISSVVPAQAAAGTTVQLAVNSSYANGALDAFFVDGNGNRDPDLAVTAMDVDPTGGQVRITVQIAPGAAKGEHLLRVFTPNGESSATPLQGNLLSIL